MSEVLEVLLAGNIRLTFGMFLGFLIAMSFDKMLHATYASLGSVFSYFFLSGKMYPVNINKFRAPPRRKLVAFCTNYS